MLAASFFSLIAVIMSISLLEQSHLWLNTQRTPAAHRRPVVQQSRVDCQCAPLALDLQEEMIEEGQHLLCVFPVHTHRVDGSMDSELAGMALCGGVREVGRVWACVPACSHRIVAHMESSEASRNDANSSSTSSFLYVFSSNLETHDTYEEPLMAHRTLEDR